ncbi:hypothetical protein FRC12_015643 [Ceratobasidium sp. 428]|nr:hypothetical protein FRC12_015643 [Ceratobasidium sp. 428]
MAQLSRMPLVTLWTLDGPPEDDSDIEVPPPVPPRPFTAGEAQKTPATTSHDSDTDSDQDEFYDTTMTEHGDTTSREPKSNTSSLSTAPPNTSPDSASVVQSILAGERHTATFPGTSQYSRGGSSACGLSSMNAIRIAFNLFSNVQDSEALISRLIGQDYVKDAMEIATYWTNETHLEVEPILELPLFARSLQVTDVQYRDVRFRTFSDALFALQSNEGPPGPRAVLLTRPPEIIAVIYIPLPIPTNSTSRSKTQSLYLIFDSHPRPDHPDGTAVRIFPSHPADTVADYLADLFQIDAALMSDPTLEWHVQLLGQVSCHFLAPANIAEPQNEYAMNMAFLELKQQLFETKRKLDTEEKEKRQLRSRSFNLQQEIALLRNTDRMKNEEIRQLKGQLRETENQPWTNCSDWSWDHAEKPDKKGKGREVQVSRAIPVIGEYMSQIGSHFGGAGRSNHQPKTSSRPAPSRARTIAATTAGPSSPRSPDDDIEDTDLRSLEVAMAMQQEFDKERVTLLEDQQFAQAIERRKFDCNICMDSFTDEAIALVDGCDHSSCRECMRGHVQSKIDERRYPIPCPFCVAGSDDKSGVKSRIGVISPMLVETIGVTPELFNIYTELQMAEHSIMIDCRGCLYISQRAPEEH